MSVWKSKRMLREKIEQLKETERKLTGIASNCARGETPKKVMLRNS